MSLAALIEIVIARSAREVRMRDEAISRIQRTLVVIRNKGRGTKNEVRSK